MRQVTKNLGIDLYGATDEPGLIAGYVTAMTKLDEAASKAGIDTAARAMAAAAQAAAATADAKAEAAGEAAATADGKATAAGSTATAAQATAAEAATAAATADGKAVIADGKAEVAATAAATADGKAVIADGKADAAATAAATADAKAVAAQSRADAAYALAEQAGGIPPLKRLSRDEMITILQPNSEFNSCFTIDTVNNEGYVINLTKRLKFVQFKLNLVSKSVSASSHRIRDSYVNVTDNVSWLDCFPTIAIATTSSIKVNIYQDYISGGPYWAPSYMFYPSASISNNQRCIFIMQGLVQYATDTDVGTDIN